MAVVASDALRHSPEAEDDDTWQESFMVGWYDPASRVGGLNHISLKTPRSKAHVWSILMVDGQVVSRIREDDLALPDADYDDLRIGPLRVRYAGNGSGYAFDADYPGGPCFQLEYTAAAEPIELSLNVGGVARARRHYETFGRLSGTLEIGGSSRKIRAWAFQDHSWGQRRLTLDPGRWIFASFGEDLAFSLYTFKTGTDRRAAGWVWDGGVLRWVERAEFGAVVHDDGLSPLACDTKVWTTDGHGYRLTGEVASSTHWGADEWWAGDGFTEFESGGRLGSGILEVKELRTMTPQQQAALGLA